MICKHTYKLIVAGSFLCMTVSCLQAQNMTSPYSVYGIGIIDHGAYNRTSGMGHTGLSLKSSTFLINNNPASIASLDRSFYIVDLGLSGKSVQYAGDPIDEGNSSNRDFGVKRIALAVKLNNFWASSIGFRQYSNVNYQYRGSVTIEGSSQKYTTLYEGNGGLNNFYWTNAFAIGKRLQAGVNLGVISGSVNKTESLTDDAISTSIETLQQDFYSKLRLEYGLLYSIPVTKKWNVSVGGRFAAKTSFSPERTVTITQNNSVIVDEELVDSDPFSLPLSYGVGLSLSNSKVTIAADYTTEKWSKLKMKGNGWSMVDNHRFSGGIEFSKQVVLWNQPVEKRYFQFGGFVDNSSLSVRSNQITQYGFTAGYGGSYRGLLYNLSLELGKRGTIDDGLIKENYVQFTLGISYRDFLFSKGRKYD